jgi:hypothetical protein
VIRWLVSFAGLAAVEKDGEWELATFSFP